jgi:hypothetical protein
MIQSAMMFALGFFVSGLLWLAFSVALVRRTRRITERRIVAKVAIRRAEFEAERDELRARHAVQMHRLEREVSRVLDLATAHRLDADIKERDLGSAKAELAARLEDLQDLEQSLIVHRDLVQDLERRNAEARTALRATQHALQTETRRRLAAEAAAVGIRLEPATGTAETHLGSAIEPSLPVELDDVTPLRTPAPTDAMLADGADGHRASVVPLRTRGSSGDSMLLPAGMSEPVRDMRRLAGEAHADFEKNVWRAPAVGENPDRQGPGDQVLDAVEEIRGLKRTATQAGE